MTRTNEYSVDPCIVCGKFIMPGEGVDPSKVPGLRKVRGWVCQRCADWTIDRVKK